jgi:hypothetical protein
MDLSPATFGPTASIATIVTSIAAAAATATTAITTTSTATTAITATATTTTTTGTFRSTVNLDGTTIEILAIHFLNSALGVGIVRERDKTKTTAATSLAVLDHGGMLHITKVGETLAKGLVAGSPT